MSRRAQDKAGRGDRFNYCVLLGLELPSVESREKTKPGSSRRQKGEAATKRERQGIYEVPVIQPPVALRMYEREGLGRSGEVRGWRVR